MASHLPIPLPPRTPTPPTPIPDEHNFALEHDHERSTSRDLFSQRYTHHSNGSQSGIGISVDSAPYTGQQDVPTLLSPPWSATFNGNGGLSPQRTPMTASTDGGFNTIDSSAGAGERRASVTVTNPFNFQTVQYERDSNAGKNELLGKRRGHKYRHSSIHAVHMDQIFKSPQIQRTPLSVPASLPLPTRRELWLSMTRHQTARLAWCAAHFAIAAYVQYSGAGSLAMTALSRLLLFDASGATVCVVVDVMGNFEVWKRSSIKHPFGLERADVLAGFGMAVFIAFMGLDVISHGIQHALENVGNHEAHSPHAHERVTMGHVDIASMLSIVSTLVSALLLKNHARIGRAMRFELLAGWGRILGNPSHFLTLSCSILLLLLPFLPTISYSIFDKVLAFTIASFMILLGARLGTSLASMLLMSFNATSSAERDGLKGIVEAIADADPAVSRVDEARFWQVHYGLCMANLKLRYRSSKGGYGMVGDDLVRIRKKVGEVVRKRLGGGRWDVSVQLAVERD
ncbi:unnamed protein product [Zymoseptoria tritici ST99CH_1A5]|nr:unnamed protein product [Zymoseptoria tritici ST99CH_1E4]SMR49353.1 unnamed protein product [Zymoseptoria tritici ST99CH_3D1]SMY22052.1 unnamed protein product [Zymoseptoria tritici ST99CH_1A5]